MGSESIILSRSVARQATEAGGYANTKVGMGKFDKLRQKIIGGSSDANIDFSNLCQLLIRLGFEERVRGDHHIFTRSGVEEIINIQPIGAKAKPYQVRQVRNLIIKYRLGEHDVD